MAETRFSRSYLISIPYLKITVINSQVTQTNQETGFIALILLLKPGNFLHKPGFCVSLINSQLDNILHTRHQAVNLRRLLLLLLLLMLPVFEHQFHRV